MSLLSGRKMTFFSNSVFYEVMNTSINLLCSYMDNFFVFLDDLKDSEEIFLFYTNPRPNIFYLLKTISAFFSVYDHTFTFC